MAKPQFDFTGKVAWVTGGGTGIGQSVAVAFAQLGAKVVVSGRSNGDETLRLIKEAGGDAKFVRCDISKAADVQNAVQTVADTYGGLNIAFNNAGVGVVGIPLAEQTEKDYDYIMDTDLKGLFFCMKYEIPEMLKAGGGSIINTGSVASVIGDPGMAVYVAAKHGAAGMTKAAAWDYGRQNIRVNLLAAGFTNTPMTSNWLSDPKMVEMVSSWNALGRYAMPDEMVGLVLLLASPLGSFMSGGVYCVDAGQSVH
ncbi:MAG: SDR family oxidoreductase [Gracilibacteraceae bacterium]|jgi:NAD(P)-dependent dehydrogenase (short-subunit alcohol dehydrogenase family)|nr:SDR family oxidoreductase [Gracilibacteraceae bacterium]